MRKPLAMAMALTMAASLVLAGCSSSSSTESTDSSSDTAESTDSGSSSGGGSSLQLLNGKPEIDTQLQELASKYQEETGNSIEIMTIGGTETASSKLKELKQADEMPDIFFAEAKDFATWEGELEDMTGWDWTEDTSAEYVDSEMGTIGFPYNTEACGLAYNKNILDEAGVDPASLTSPDAYKEAFETIDSKKDDLGLTAVVAYAANANNIGWSTGTHIFGQYLDAGLEPTDRTYIDLLNDGGQLDADRFTKFGEFIGMLNQYSDDALRVDGTYDDQVLGFASGKYAFMTNGSWTGATLTGDDSDAYEAAGSFECGFAPYAFEDGINTILNGGTNYWTVYSSGNVDGAKDFLNWFIGDTAQQIMVEEAGFISPFEDCAFESTDPFAAAVTEWLADGKFSAYHTMEKKDGLNDATSVVFQEYAKGDIATAEEFTEEVQKVCTDYYAN
ncbi:MAG: extracellular solute-binding protein [Lachnospiraceae bacterium]|nr:extracellular solute-binding protein [Lachnospiraceae bacterium]